MALSTVESTGFREPVVAGNRVLIYGKQGILETDSVCSGGARSSVFYVSDSSSTGLYGISGADAGGDLADKQEENYLERMGVVGSSGCAGYANTKVSGVCV